MDATRLARPAGAATPDLPALARKYRTLAELRAAREDAAAAGQDRFEGEALAARGRAFREIARAFPGALRELEVTHTAMLRAKAARVEAAASGEGLAPWIAVVWDFHAMLRELLALRRFLRADPGCSAEALRAHHAGLPDAGAMITDAAAARGDPGRPPRGPLLALVWPALARRHGVDEAQARAMVFGPVE